MKKERNFIISKNGYDLPTYKEFAEMPFEYVVSFLVYCRYFKAYYIIKNDLIYDAYINLLEIEHEYEQADNKLKYLNYFNWCYGKADRAMKKYIRHNYKNNVFSYNNKTKEGDEIGDLIIDEKPNNISPDLNFLYFLIDSLLFDFSFNEQQILVDYIYKELDNKEIGKKYNVSSVFINKLVDNFREKMRNELLRTKYLDNDVQLQAIFNYLNHFRTRHFKSRAFKKNMSVEQYKKQVFDNHEKADFRKKLKNDFDICDIKIKNICSVIDNSNLSFNDFFKKNMNFISYQLYLNKDLFKEAMKILKYDKNKLALKMFACVDAKTKFHFYLYEINLLRKKLFPDKKVIDMLVVGGNNE